MTFSQGTELVQHYVIHVINLLLDLIVNIVTLWLISMVNDGECYVFAISLRNYCLPCIIWSASLLCF